MALKQSVQIANNYPTINADGYEPIVIFGDYTTVAGLAANDVIEMMPIPAGYVVTGVKLSCDDLDTGAGITLDCGLVSGKVGLVDNARTCGNEAFAASTIGQSGGIQTENKVTLLNAAPSTADQSLGLKIGVAAAGLVVGAKIRLTAHARPALHGK